MELKVKKKKTTHRTTGKGNEQLVNRRNTKDWLPHEEMLTSLEARELWTSCPIAPSNRNING